MKWLTTLLLLLASICSASAQNWAPFPLDATSEWSIGEGIFDGLCVHTYHHNFRYSGIQQLDGHEYVILSGIGTHSSQNANDNLPECVVPEELITTGGLLRVENGKYYEPAGFGEENLIFDFTLNVGDTLVNQSREFVIDSIDQVTVGSHSCIRQWVANEFDQPIWIIEGVGHQFGLFQPIYQFENNSSICYRQNGESLFYYPDWNSCYFLGADELPKSNEVISPNPSSGIFRMETSQASSYRVYDLFGRIINRGQLNGTSELDLTSQPNGIYLISFETENGISTSKLVKQ